MTIHERNELVSRAIVRQRVCRGIIAVEPVPAVLVGCEFTAQVIGRLVLGVLEVVFAIGAGLPDVHDGAGDGLAGEEMGNGAVHFADTTLWIGILDDRAAVVAERGGRRPEGAEDGRRRRIGVILGDDLVGYLVNES